MQTEQNGTEQGYLQTWMTPVEAAEYFDVCLQTIYYWIADRQLSCADKALTDALQVTRPTRRYQQYFIEKASLERRLKQTNRYAREEVR